MPIRKLLNNSFAISCITKGLPDSRDAIVNSYTFQGFTRRIGYLVFLIWNEYKYTNQHSLKRFLARYCCTYICARLFIAFKVFA